MNVDSNTEIKIPAYNSFQGLSAANMDNNATDVYVPQRQTGTTNMPHLPIMLDGTKVGSIDFRIEKYDIDEKVGDEYYHTKDRPPITDTQTRKHLYSAIVQGGADFWCEVPSGQIAGIDSANNILVRKGGSVLVAPKTMAVEMGEGKRLPNGWETKAEIF